MIATAGLWGIVTVLRNLCCNRRWCYMMFYFLPDSQTNKMTGFLVAHSKHAGESSQAGETRQFLKNEGRVLFRVSVDALGSTDTTNISLRACLTVLTKVLVIRNMKCFFCASFGVRQQGSTCVRYAGRGCMTPFTGIPGPLSANAFYGRC